MTATSSGRVGAVKPTSTTNTTLVQANTNIVVCYVFWANQGATDDNVRIAVTQSASSNPAPASTDYIVYGRLCKATGDASFMDAQMLGPIELNPANLDQIVVYSTTGTTSFVATGDAGLV